MPVPTDMDPSGKLLCRDWKTHEMTILGDMVPLVRCCHHDKYLNVSFGGQTWWSPLKWAYVIKPTYHLSPADIPRGD